MEDLYHTELSNKKKKKKKIYFSSDFHYIHHMEGLITEQDNLVGPLIPKFETVTRPFL